MLLFIKQRKHPLLGRSGVVTCALLAASLGWADGPKDNIPSQVRPVPPVGMEFPATRTQPLLEAALALQAEAPKQAPRAPLLADVLIYGKAVEWAIAYKELYQEKHLSVAETLLAEGKARLEKLRLGQTPWLQAGGLVVRAYRSRIDRSIQPYGLVFPPTWKPDDGKKWPLHIWFHGRGETLTELDFINQRQSSAGEFTPSDAIVLHPYGRYCNGSRFAGETDCWEALEAVKSQYSIDPGRIAVRGFSLGGAACWHMAVHHPSKWFAANPGAGFSETEQFLNFFQNETLKPFPWERRLWAMHDATTLAANLSNTRVVAYSGELDKQKQAADIMVAAMQREGMTLQHVLGAQMGHKYDPPSKAIVGEQLANWQSAGLARDFTKPLTFVTHTLKYATCHWVSLHGLEQHWAEARVSFQPDGSITSKNVSSLTLTLPEDLALKLDGSAVKNGTWQKIANKWQPGEVPQATTAALRKISGLQGPVDDAFTGPFFFVKPTGTSANPTFAKWCQEEMDRAAREWRRHFRGEVRWKLDSEITSDEMKTANLILWGDFQSNQVIARLLPKLPMTWTAQTLKIGKVEVPAEHHAPVLIYPNPLQPKNYIVLNSGFTFREYDYLNNARQTPKLPDWAIFDLTEPPNTRFAGKVASADFFDEAWQP